MYAYDTHSILPITLIISLPTPLSFHSKAYRENRERRSEKENQHGESNYDRNTAWSKPAAYRRGRNEPLKKKIGKNKNNSNKTHLRI